jgi:hypothetical protein
MDNSQMSQEDLQALIDETEALGWDKHNHLVAHDGILMVLLPLMKDLLSLVSFLL